MRASSLLNNSLEELLMTFASSSERPEWPEVSSSKLPSTSYTCLSWDSFECAPHPTSSVRVHSRQRCRCLRSSRCTLADSFRPRGFAPPRRFTPRSKFRACCIPVPEGVRRVSTPCCRVPPNLPKKTGSHSDITAFSRCALHTPRRSPPASSRTASLRPLPPRRCACALHMNKFMLPSPTLDLEALLHCRVRSASRPLPVVGRPLLPWA